MVKSFYKHKFSQVTLPQVKVGFLLYSGSVEVQPYAFLLC